MKVIMESFKYQGITISYGEFRIKIRNGFRTAHTYTTERHNFIVRIELDGCIGEGEAGLPPKKADCYLANIQDCLNLIHTLKICLQTHPNNLLLNPLQLPPYFTCFLQSTHHAQLPHLRTLLQTLHSIPNPQYRACRSALEFAILDLWSKLLNKSLNECIFGSKVESKFRTFFTVSFDEDVQRMVDEAREGLKHSPLIKIKMNNQVERNRDILRVFKNKNIGERWVIDANASWEVKNAISLLETIVELKIREKIMYIEQPFPVKFSVEQWQPVREAYNKEGIKIMADQSFSTADDVEKVALVADAVNIKIQKTGGLINALKAIQQAKKAGKEVWIGSMISSHLGCTQAYQLYPLAEFGDLDGGWLTQSPYQSGFIAREDGLLDNAQRVGLGAQMLKQ